MTFSINTNNAALAALQSLSMTQSALDSTENAVSTGLKVSSASDNPAIYAISSSMNANIAGLSAVSDSLSFGSSVLSTASSATADIISTLTTLQNTVTDAGTTGISTSDIQTAVYNALNDINTYARQSTFNGVNLLTATGDSGATYGAVSVVDNVAGGTLGVANQVTGTNTTLTDQLGLTETLGAGGTVSSTAQTSLNASATSGGINLVLGQGLQSSSFDDGNSLTLTNAATGKTTTFEFETSTGTATTVPNSATNTTVAVLVDPTTQSSSSMLANLVSSMNANGFSANIQSDGSINIAGGGVTSATGDTNSGGFGAAIASQSTLTSSQGLITTIQHAISSMTGIAAAIGASSQQITGLQSFTSSLSDAMTSGVGALVDADLSEESAKLTSLQTKQQLAIQSLSIANSQSSSILSLFR